MQFYDPAHRRVVMRQQKATAAFWEGQWAHDADRAHRTAQARPTWVSRATQRFMAPADGLIVEGGCGTALHVAALRAAGYACVGVDFAEQALHRAKETLPALDLAASDVRRLALADGCAYAYWSLGVIEHFWDGYAPIVDEAARVLQPGGLLFLSFPALSPVRRLRVRAGGYPRFEGRAEPADFYQFLLDPAVVSRQVTAQGFTLVHRQGIAGLIGARYELPLVRGPLRRLERYRGHSRLIRGGRALLDRLLAPVTGHSVLLVFRRSRAR